MKRFIGRAIFYATIMFAVSMSSFLVDPPDVPPGELARRTAMGAGIFLGGGVLLSLLDLIRLRILSKGWPGL